MGSCLPLSSNLTWHSYEHTYSRKEMLCSFLSETHNHILLYVQNMLRGLKREIAEKAQEKKALEQRREECIEM